jgi:hypothetical protein
MYKITACSKISNKLFILIYLFIFSSISKAQTNGLAVDMQYEQRIQDARYQHQQLNKAYAERYRKFKDDYTYALGANEIKDSPKNIPSSGRFDVIITNTGSIFEKAEVVTLNNKVTSLKTSKGEVFIPLSSSEVQNFRCIIKMSENSFLEVVFTFLFD